MSLEQKKLINQFISEFGFDPFAQQDAQAVPQGWRVERVSDDDVRVYGPDAETWLLRANPGKGTFEDFAHRFCFALASCPQPEAAPPGQQDALAVPQPPMLRWRELADYPAETGRYIVAHCGQVGGHAYYTAREGDTHYPVGWAQLPDFKPTHWLDGPRIGTGDAALNTSPTPPAQGMPVVCQGTNCGAADGQDHSPECIIETAEAQGWGDAPEVVAARQLLNAAPTPTAQEKQS